MGFRLTPAGGTILDGAMGTELIARGLEIQSDIAERWVLDRPEEVAAIHRAYKESGAHAIQTCSFGALPTRLAQHGLQDRADEICARSVELARQAAPGIGVVGSLGPTGLVTCSEQGLDRALLQQIEGQVRDAAAALARAGADAIHLETQYNPGELGAAAHGVRAGAPDIPLWISITVMTGGSGLETPQGVPIDRMIRALREAAPEAVGVNCSLDGDRIRGAVERLAAAGIGYVLARPQARVSEKCATGRSRETPERFADRAALLFELGAHAVGGCCGTSPGSIAALSARLPASRHIRSTLGLGEVTR